MSKAVEEGVKRLNFAHKFGANLKRLRNEKGWTQEELAERVGVSRLDIGLIERGRKRVHLLLAEKICGAFNIPLTFMVDELSTTDYSDLLTRLSQIPIELRMEYLQLLENLEIGRRLAEHNLVEAQRWMWRIFLEIGHKFFLQE